MSFKDNKTVIAKLENIQNLVYEARCEQAFLEYDSDRIFSEKMSNLKKDLGSLEVPSVFSDFPIFPIDSSYCSATKKDKEEREKIFRIVLIATVAALLLYFIIGWQFLNTISVIGLIATAVTGYLFNTSKKEYNKKKAVYDESVEKFNSTYNRFLSSLKNFEQEKESCIAAAREYAKKYATVYDKHMDEYFNKVDAEQKANDRISEITNELSSNDIIVPEYFHLIDAIIGNLKTGRAENYKEALNIAIREEKEENERQARLAQEEERNQILAMQAEEERRHNEQMERQQREHDAAVLREQKRQNDAIVREQRQQAQETQRAADRAASESRKQASAMRSAGISKCANCMNRLHCPTYVKESGAGLNCGGYKPYGSK